MGFCVFCLQSTVINFKNKCGNSNCSKVYKILCSGFSISSYYLLVFGAHAQTSVWLFMSSRCLYPSLYLQIQMWISDYYFLSGVNTFGAEGWLFQFSCVIYTFSSTSSCIQPELSKHAFYWYSRNVIEQFASRALLNRIS